jgi:pimeloyl-ACP methyl ester carboxylesterase
MRHRSERRYGVRFAEIDRIADLEQLHVPSLFVHDSDDAEIPFEHSLRLLERMPGARLIKTYGLGHYRILRNPAVVGAVVDFVRGNVGELPAELPVLPRPAPIY